MSANTESLGHAISRPSAFRGSILFVYTGPDDCADSALQYDFPNFDILRGRGPLVPCREFMPIAGDQCCADDQPEDRAPVIAATAAQLAPVRRQASPERRASAGFQRMCAHAHHARPLARIGAVLTGFAEEIDAARRPFHAAAAVSQSARAANRFFEPVQNRIEANEVGQPSVAHHFWRSPQTSCHAANSLGLIW